MNPATTNYGLQIILNEALRQALILFTLPQAAHVILKVMNGEDKEVRLLLNEELIKGGQSIPFSFGNLTGSYTIRLMINMQDAIDIENQPINISN